MPLIRQFWLARKPKKKVALEPIIDREAKRVDFRVVQGNDVSGDPALGTISRGDARCLLCGQVVKAAQVHEIGRAGDMSARMIAGVLAPDGGGGGGKSYRAVSNSDVDIFRVATAKAEELYSQSLNGLPAIPDEPLAYHPQYMNVREYSLDEWGKLFNERQLLALTTLARLAGVAYTEMLSRHLDTDYATATATYLGLAIDRQATRTSMNSFWDAGGEKVQQLFARQALPMVWEFVESAPLQKPSGGFSTNLETTIDAIRQQSFPALLSKALRHDAGRDRASTFKYIVTDPPYYDAINYANLSDFFYVWLKRSAGHLHPDLLAMPVTPKREQTVMNVYADGAGPKENHEERARQRYVDGMAKAFRAMAASLEPDGLTGVVFAHSSPDAWATLIEGLLDAGLVPNVSWPIDTEMQTGLKVVGQARLKTSVWMACRKRPAVAGEAFLGDVIEEMRPVIRERLLYFWSQGIRGADFFISAIGPGLSVFGRHQRVLRPDGAEVSVREFLDIVRRESTAVALEQVLQGTDLGAVDPLTQQYVTWVWSYSRAPLDAGEALALCLATGAPFDELTREHSIAVATKQGSKKVVKLRSIAERAREDEQLGEGASARPAALIDELQRAAWLWGQNQQSALGRYRNARGESRWAALQTLGQAVAACLPDGDEDRRIILGLLSSTVRGSAPTPATQSFFPVEETDGTD